LDVLRNKITEEEWEKRKRVFLWFTINYGIQRDL
jgi:hypothetical protein